MHFYSMLGIFTKNTLTLATQKCRVGFDIDGVTFESYYRPRLPGANIANFYLGIMLTTVR